MSAQAVEWQFDGLVGPTHNYAGLSYGNLASGRHRGALSNPRMAALQGLEKMKFVRNLGMKQAFIPPRYRPLISELQLFGFDCGTLNVVDLVAEQAPHLLAAIYSSSYMWAANAATVAPSMDSADGRLHLTVANLVTNYHRSLEAMDTYQLLGRLFPDPKRFAVHPPLPAATALSDEGAANHMRLCGNSHGNLGLHVFVHGDPTDQGSAPRLFPARQKLESYKTIARLHQLHDESIFFMQQHPDAIDAGVFHNDVIAMNTTRLMLIHEKALVNQKDNIDMLQKAANARFDWQFIEIPERDLPLSEAVQSYFFNSQMLQLPDGRIVIVAPTESEENPHAHNTLQKLAAGNAIAGVHYLDVRESMRNGGGPACLRLRIVMTPEESAAMHQEIILTDEKYEQLVGWVHRHYRDRLSFEDLRDPAFIEELNRAYEALEPIIGLPGFYTSRMQ